ncbi:MAG: hypothetical protein F4Y44_05960 [Chloroflexi bacterium]|nr:hypothetical protein [Chloroflexota bacterium]
MLLLPLLILSIFMLVLGVVLVRRRKDNLLLLAMGITTIALTSSFLALGALMLAAIFALS